jgi:hypothetical protein
VNYLRSSKTNVETILSCIGTGDLSAELLHLIPKIIAADFREDAYSKKKISDKRLELGKPMLQNFRLKIII